MGVMPRFSRSATWSGLDRSARIPPWILGWRVFTRPPSISGASVTSATSRTGSPASAMADAVPPLDTSSQPRSTRPLARSTTPVLSYTETRARTFRSFGGSGGGQDEVAGHEGGDGVGVEAALDRLDALVQGLDGVVRQDGHGLLGDDRAGVDLSGGDVHRAAGDLHPIG